MYFLKFFSEPSAPQNVAVTSVTATSVELTWSPPLTKNGIIRNYTVIAKSQSFPQEETQTSVSGESSTCLVEGLYGHENYTLQVQACTTSTMWGTLSDKVTEKTHIGGKEHFKITESPYLCQQSFCLLIHWSQFTFIF